MSQIQTQSTGTPDAEQASDEIVKLIRKLRWIGMDAEANVLTTELRRIEPGCSAFYMPRDTD